MQITFDGFSHGGLGKFRTHFFRDINDPVLAEIYALRGVCWASAYADGATLNDKFDALADHWAIFDSTSLVAAARLTVHQDLYDVPDAHLFENAHGFLAAPTAYISRLVVDPKMRHLGLSNHLDLLRLNKAKAEGCKSAVVVWNKMSGEFRRQKLGRLGFRSLDDSTPHLDGAFGTSFILGMSLSGWNNDEMS